MLFSVLLSKLLAHSLSEQSVPGACFIEVDVVQPLGSVDLTRIHFFKMFFVLFQPQIIRDFIVKAEYQKHQKVEINRIFIVDIRCAKWVPGPHNFFEKKLSHQPWTLLLNWFFFMELLNQIVNLGLQRLWSVDFEHFLLEFLKVDLIVGFFDFIKYKIASSIQSFEPPFRSFEGL